MNMLEMIEEFARKMYNKTFSEIVQERDEKLKNAKTVDAKLIIHSLYDTFIEIFFPLGSEILEEFCMGYDLHFYKLTGANNLYAIHYCDYKLTVNADTGYTIVTSPTIKGMHQSFKNLPKALDYIDFDF